jgi:hypothetical protein
MSEAWSPSSWNRLPAAQQPDWPDAAAMDRYVRHLPARNKNKLPFRRFPSWMWRNTDVAALTEPVPVFDSADEFSSGRLPAGKTVTIATEPPSATDLAPAGR